MTPETLGRYEIRRELGKGAMGVVYLAEDPLIQRLVAIKTFRMAYSAKEKEVQQFRERFLREARAIGKLSHPNIVTVHDLGEEDNEVFIAMEYVDGVNLKQKMQQEEGLLALDFVIDVTSQIAEGLAGAHIKGIVHRDVKPANIIITQDQLVKITDFGIARMDQSNLTVAGQLLGTPNYMAPEQIQGKPVDARTDIFSLGVLLYEMLTRKKPFAGENLTQVSHRIVYDDFRPPDEFVDGLPGELSGILQRALQKDPDSRYQVASEMASDLKALLEPEEPQTGQILTEHPAVVVPEVPVVVPEVPTESSIETVIEQMFPPTPTPMPSVAPPTVAPPTVAPPTAASPAVKLPSVAPPVPVESASGLAPPPAPSSEHEPFSDLEQPAKSFLSSQPSLSPPADSVPPLPPPSFSTGSGSTAASVGDISASASDLDTSPSVSAVPPLLKEPPSDLFRDSTPSVLPTAGLTTGSTVVEVREVLASQTPRGVAAKTRGRMPWVVLCLLALVALVVTMMMVLTGGKGSTAEAPKASLKARSVAEYPIVSQLASEKDILAAYVGERIAAVGVMISEEDYEQANPILEQILLVDPENGWAKQKAEDIRRHIDRRTPVNRKLPRQDSANSVPSKAPPRVAPSPPPTPSPVDLGISFRTHIAEGQVTVYVNKDVIVQESFEFDNRRSFKKRFLRAERGFDWNRTLESGTVEFEVVVEVELKEGRQALSRKTLGGNLIKGMARTLSIAVLEDSTVNVSLQ